MKKLDILDLLKKGTVLGDGGYVFELERRGYLQAGPYTPEVALEHPEALEQLHVEFLRAGAEVLQALTFYASEDKLEISGRAHLIQDINRAAVRIAKKAAKDDALVAGVVTLTPSYEHGNVESLRKVRGLFDHQIALQKDEGVDFIIGETFINLEEALLALDAIKASGLPSMLTMNFTVDGSSDGFSVEDCARRLADRGADIIGMNCNYDPEVSLMIVERMRKAVNIHIACQPVAYSTPHGTGPFFDHYCFPLSLEQLQLSRFELASFARRARDIGVGYIGGCCGVLAYHVRAMAEALGRRPPASEKSPNLARHVIPEIRTRSDEEYWHAAAH